MYQDDYAFEDIMRNKREELVRRLDRRSSYYKHPDSREKNNRIVHGLSLILVSIRNLFIN